PLSSVTSPTSGNAWSRRFLAKVFPIPEKEYRICADAYLCSLAPAAGLIGKIPEPLASYRIHGQNHFWLRSFDDKLKLGYDTHEQQCETLAHFLGAMGFRPDPDSWRSRSWYHRVRQSIQEI